MCKPIVQTKNDRWLAFYEHHQHQNDRLQLKYSELLVIFRHFHPKYTTHLHKNDRAHSDFGRAADCTAILSGTK